MPVSFPRVYDGSVPHFIPKRVFPTGRYCSMLYSMIPDMVWAKMIVKWNAVFARFFLENINIGSSLYLANQKRQMDHEPKHSEHLEAKFKYCVWFESDQSNRPNGPRTGT